METSDRFVVFVSMSGRIDRVGCRAGDSLGLNDMHKLVNGYIETVPTCLPDNIAGEPDVSPIMIVNEEGKLIGLPENYVATALYSQMTIDVIVGNAIIMGVRGEELIGFRSDYADRIMSGIAFTAGINLSIIGGGTK